ncbi:MAG: YfhO family protein [Bacteroidales bacterium]
MNIKEIITTLSKNKEVKNILIAIVCFAAIAWGYFIPDALHGNLLQQHDVQQGVAIGQEVKAFTEATGETSRWTNSLFSGMPNFQISPSYESSKLISWIWDIYTLSFPAPVNILFIMMLGFYILLRAFKSKWYVAILGAVAYAFSTYFFIIIGAGHIWKYITLAYIPPTIAGIVWCYRGKYLMGASVAALFATLQIAANHIQMSYYFIFVIVAMVITFLITAIKSNRVKGWSIATLSLLAAAILAVAANSPNLYNTYKYSKETMRGGHSEITTASANATSGGLNKDYITQWSYGIDETLSLIIPNINGGATIRPEKGENKLMSLADTDTARDMYNSGKLHPEIYNYLKQFPQYFGDQPMTNGPVYVGALIFALFIIGCITIKGKLKWALLAVTLLSILLSWGHNFMALTDLFIDYFPLYNKFRTVSSILVIAEFTIPLLAMLALSKMLTEKDFIKRNRTTIYTTFSTLGFLMVLCYIAPSVFVGGGFSAMEYESYIVSGMVNQAPELFTAIENIRLDMLASDALRSFVVLAIGFIALVAYERGMVKRNALFAAIALIIIVDLFSVNKRYLNSNSFITAPVIATTNNVGIKPRPVDIQILADTTMHYRVMDVSKFSEATPSYFHKTIGGYHAAKLSRYQDLIDYQISKNNINVLNMLNAKYFIMDDNTVYPNPEALGNAWFIDRIKYTLSAQEEMDSLTNINPAEVAYADIIFNDILGNEVIDKGANDTIYLTSYAPNKLTYYANSENGGVAVFSEVYFPWGWKATIDGENVEIGRVNYILRAINVPAGEHQIIFTFEPTSVTVTETLAYIAIIIIYLSLILSILFAIKGCKYCTSEDDNIVGEL